MIPEARSLGAAANSSYNELVKLANKAVNTTKRAGSQKNIRMAKNAGLKVAKGGTHMNVYDAAGTKISQIPYTIHAIETAKDIVRNVLESVSYKKDIIWIKLNCKRHGALIS